jgi:MoaA/NifB/PqqE/SkfB family radical SAM enzyme
MRTLSLHFPVETYYHALASERFQPEQQRAIEDYFRETDAKAVIYGFGKTGRMLCDILGQSYLFCVNSDTIGANINVDFDCILVGTSPGHYRDVYHNIKRFFADKDVTVIFPFEFCEPAEHNAQAQGKETPSAVWDDFYRFSKLLINITNSCNLKCEMCGVHREKTKLTLSREHILEAARFGLDNGFSMIELTGGEPFLIDAVYDAIDLLRNTKPMLFITTNATLLSDEQIEFLAGINNLHIQISFDGTREIHNAIRGRAFAFDNADRAVRKMAALGIPFSINSVVQRANMFDLYDLYRHFADLPYAYHAFCLYEPNSANIDTVRLPSEDLPEFTKVLHRINEAANKENKPAQVDNLLKVVDQRVDKIDDSPRANRFMHPGLCCTVPRTTLILQRNGLVIPCYHHAWEKSGIERNVANKSMHDIVFSREYMLDILHATGPNGCPGCSTNCYAPDADFYRKIYSPTLTDRVIADLNELAHAPDAVFG